MATGVLEVRGPPQGWRSTVEGLQESARGKALTVGRSGGKSTGLERKWAGQWAGPKFISINFLEHSKLVM